MTDTPEFCAKLCAKTCGKLCAKMLRIIYPLSLSRHRPNGRVRFRPEPQSFAQSYASKLAPNYVQKHLHIIWAFPTAYAVGTSIRTVRAHIVLWGGADFRRK